jgi:hypothetical protein
MIYKTNDLYDQRCSRYFFPINVLRDRKNGVYIDLEILHYFSNLN